jgi:predicted DsbA family dithiol-disulfide isomerase
MSDERYKEYARQLGLDMQRFERDAASSSVRDRVTRDASEAASLGVTGTPAFFINGRFLSGAQPYESFAEIIDRELEKSG